MNLVDFMRMTRANVFPLLAITLTGLLGALGITALQPRVYQATATGWVSSASTDVQANIAVSQMVAGQYAKLGSDRTTAERIIKSLGLKTTPDVVASRITAVNPEASTQVLVSAAGATPEEAQNLANAAVKAIAEEGAITTTGGLVGSDGNAKNKPSVVMIPRDSALLPGAPVSPSTRRNLLAGLLVGLGVGYLIAFARKTLDSRVRYANDVEELAKAPVLGIVPDTEELRDRQRGGFNRLGQAKEAMRLLRTNLRFVDVDNPPRSIVVTSALQGEGKSTLAANLARVLAAAGQRTALIEADLRRPTVAMIFGLDGHVGVTQVLAGDVEARDVIQPSEHPLLSIIPAGRIPPNPSELLGSRRMRELIEDLSRDHFVVLDAPPLLPVTDAGLLSAQADGVLLVLATGRTRKEQVELCRKVLDQVGGNLLGSVLNRAPRRGMGSIMYGYGYGGYGSDSYGYGYGGDQEYVATHTAGNRSEGRSGLSRLLKR